MAEVEFNGSSGNIPDFALEDTQQKILTALKKQFKLDEKDIANAQKALRNDDKNTKAQLNALKDLGSDIRDAVDGKGTFFSSLSSGVSKTAGVLGTLGKVGGGLASGLIGLSSAVAVGVLNLTKGFGDDLKNAGLAESGAAFGSLGKELTTVVPGMMTLGLSVEQAAGAVNDFRGSMTATSGTAIQGVITEFQKLTNGGAAYGRTISENIEYLADEIEYRTRQGFITDRNAGRAAKQAQEMMDSQISASKLLGKSVDEIANGVKDLFSGDVDIAAALANLGPDVEQELRKTFQTFEGAGLPKEFQAGLAKMITDPIMLGSQEAKDAFNALSVLPDDMGDKVQSSVENLREAIDSGDANAIANANKNLEQNMLEMGSNISKLSQTEKEALFIQGNSIPFLKDLLSSQRGLAIAYENFNDKNKTELNKALENSVQFDNQITILKNSFGVILTSIKAGMAPALQSFTAALGDLSSDESPIGKFSIKLGEISKKIINKFNDLFGLAGDQEENTNMVTGLLETLGNYVAGAADSFISFVDSLLSNEGGSVMEKIGTYLSDIFVNLMGIVGDQLKNIDFMDLLFGESEQELTTDAAKRVESTKNRKRGNQTEEQQSAGLMNAISDIIDYRDEKNEKKAGSVDAEKMMEMITKAGVDAKDLTGKDLLTLFPDANDLNLALLAKYEETDAKMLFSGLSNKMIEATDARVTELDSYAMKAWHGADGAKVLQKEQLAIAKSLKDAQLAMLQDVEVTAKKRSETVEGRTLDEKHREAILSNAKDKRPETQPVQASSSSIVKDPETAKPTAPGPTSQDGTSTQAVKPAVPMADASNQENAMKSTEELISVLLTKTDTTNKILKSIAGSSSSTASNTG